MRRCAAICSSLFALFLLVGGSLPERAAAADLMRLGDGPFISSGAFLVARELGYFDKVGITIETKSFIDGAASVPSIVSGEIDISGMTASAALFNAIAKGAPLVTVLDRGNNRPGRGYTAINVSQALYDQGVRTLDDFAKLKGKKIGLGATGSINQYAIALALQRAGLDPRKDVQWITNIPQPDLVKMLGTNAVDATDLAYQFAYFAQNNKFGPIIVTDDKIDPNGQLGMYVVHKDFLKNKRDVLIRFAMAYLHASKTFNAAAGDPDNHKNIVEMLAKNTALGKPEIVRAIAPNWSYVNEDGVPNIKSVMAMQNYWADYFNYVETKVPEERIFDLSIANEALARLARDKPFGN